MQDTAPTAASGCRIAVATSQLHSQTMFECLPHFQPLASICLSSSANHLVLNYLATRYESPHVRGVYCYLCNLVASQCLSRIGLRTHIKCPEQ